MLVGALADGGTVPTIETHIIEAAHDAGIFRWRQHLKYRRVGQTVYFDEGNGEPFWP